MSAKILLLASDIFFKLSLAESEEETLIKYNEIQKHLDYIQPIFETKLRKAIGRATDVSKVDIRVDRKQFTSVLEKHQRKNRGILTFSDLLRAAVLVDRKTDPNKIINGLKHYFDIIKIDEKEASKEFSYGGAIHVDVLIEGTVCEIQIMSKSLWRYKQEADKVYKSQTTPNEQQNKWFDRGRFVEDILKDIPKKEEFDINEYAESLVKLKK
jgi:hypothetical protein